MQEKKKNVIHFSMDMEKVEEMVDQLMDSMLEKVPAEKQPFIMGFTINFNSDELPLIEEMKEFPEQKQLEKEIVPQNFQKTLAEAHYFKNEILVSFELPKNVSKNDLSVDVTEKSVFVKASKKSFFRRISLKEKIDTRNFSSNFNNSVLELAFKKKF